MFHSNSKRFTTNLIPRERYSIRVFHLHTGNDPDGSKRFEFCARGHHPAKFVTVAKAVDRKTGDTVAFATAVCGNRDTPSRSVGSGIALGRLVRAFGEHLKGLGDEVYTPPPTPVAGGLRIVHSSSI